MTNKFLKGRRSPVSKKYPTLDHKVNVVGEPAKYIFESGNQVNAMKCFSYPV